MMMQMVGAFADYAERAMLRERTKAGLEAARLGSSHWRTPADADSPIAGRNYSHGFQSK
jgi:DNA invertase Pin-like site-specific DNA recombinase